MRLWTVQDKRAYEALCETGVLRCNADLSECLIEDCFQRAYQWLVSQMKERVGAPPAGVEYPIWAWYLLGGKNAKPDLRRVEFRGYAGEQYIIEVELPDEAVLLSDEEMWHFVLKNWYFAGGAGEYVATEEFEEDNKWFDSLPVPEQESVKRKSWENIFFPKRCPWVFVQATFWELRKEDVVSVRKFTGKVPGETAQENKQCEGIG